MSEKETVEVTLKLPQKIVDTIEDLKYYGWSRNEFFEQAVRNYLSCCTNNLELDECNRIEQKYGKELFCFFLPPIFEPEEMLKRLP